MDKTMIKTSRVTLLYICPECKSEGEQPLTEIVDNGTAMCSECDESLMYLGDEVRIEDE